MPSLTDEQIVELKRLLPIARGSASKIGSMHSMWEVIFDAEALIQGKNAIVDDPEYLITQLRQYNANPRP
jgi:hypothetical protein